MTDRLDPTWVVRTTHQSDDGFHALDVFERPDGSYGFEEFRRDPEDAGLWTTIGYHSVESYPSEAAAEAAALVEVSWYAGPASPSA